MGIASLAWVANVYINYVAMNVVNKTYFYKPEQPFGVAGFMTIAPAIYLLLVSIFGSWRLMFKGR